MLSLIYTLKVSINFILYYVADSTISGGNNFFFLRRWANQRGRAHFVRSNVSNSDSDMIQQKNKIPPEITPEHKHRFT